MQKKGLFSVSGKYLKENVENDNTVDQILGRVGRSIITIVIEMLVRECNYSCSIYDDSFAILLFVWLGSQLAT